MELEADELQNLLIENKIGANRDYKNSKYEKGWEQIDPTKIRPVERFLEKKGQGTTKAQFNSSCNE